MNISSRSSRRGASGLALFISLVLLLVLTVMGVSAVQTSTLETRLARNQYDTLLAFQAAELALRDAERFIETLDPDTDFGDGDGLWLPPAPDEVNLWERPDVWSGEGSRAASSAAAVAEPPRYLIERLALVEHEGGRFAMFRVTARAVGGRTSTQALLQTTYGSWIGAGGDDADVSYRPDGVAAPRVGRLSWRELDG
jgi:type IV pilus assembly protein PilX